MAELLSLEEFAGATGGEPPSPPPGPPRQSSPATMSLEEFVGTEPQEEATPSTLFQKTLSGAKAVGGEAAALADLVLSMPGFIMGVGVQIGGTIQAAARGVPFTADPRQMNPVTAYSVGRQAGQEFAEPFMSPLHKVMKLFESGEAYEQAATTKGMEALASGLEEAGKWTEEKTGGRISRDAVPMLAETLMASAVGLAKGKKGGTVDPMIAKKMRVEAQKLREKMEMDQMQEAADAAARAERPLSPEEFAARQPVQQQINDMLGIRPPAQQAAMRARRLKELKAAFREPAEGGDYRSIEESQFRAEERLRNEADYAEQTRQGEPQGTTYEVGSRPPADRIGQSEILRILQKPGYERTAEDLITLREARKQSEGVEPFYRYNPSDELRMQLDEAAWDKRVADLNRRQTAKILAKQKGSARPEVAALLAAAGIGAIAGEELSDDQLRGALLGGAAGMSFVLPFLGKGASVPKSFKQSGAVKAPGGMWHPEAAEHLGDAIAPESRYGRGVPGPKGYAESRVWGKEAVRRYLNRYAGTERDPLKDVEIPHAAGDGRVVRWEEAFDAAIAKLPAVEIRNTESAAGRNVDWLKAVPDQEAVFGIKGGQHYPMTLKNYLSHVGDYLRQNVKPEKLKDYDLVRAVKETAENDRRVAKEMEKAAAASSKDLPVYKEYPDGYKWVELKLPEKLTEEQAKSVHQVATDEKARVFGEEKFLNSGDYIALDSQGRPVKNSYTGEIAEGKTPEEAWLAGRLAEEGNQMGHCVGGYCPSVASGETRILSLRDPKGLSHVTVEITPTDRLQIPMQRLPQALQEEVIQLANKTLGKTESYNAGEYGTPIAEVKRWNDIIDLILSSQKYQKILQNLPEPPPDIAQIKGKQNRAPEAKYLPYVQDLVKSGKWGEVGDLQNTGLVQLSSKVQEQTGLGRYITRAEGEAADLQIARGEGQEYFAPRPRNRERGFIDQKLLMGAGALGLGGIVGWALTDDPSGTLLGALAGGALMLPGARLRLDAAIKAADFGIGNLSTRIGNISPAIKLRARDFERRVLTESHAILHRVAPFMAELEKVQGPKRAALERAILTNDRQAIADLMQGNRPLVAAWREVRNVLSETGEQLQGHGRFRTMLEDYFPRLVKDVEGLKAALGVAERTRLEQALQNAERAALKARGTPLTAVETSAIINREVQGFRRATASRPGFTKPRGVEEITEALRPFYHTPAESLYAYVRGAVMDLEMARFFGKDLVQTEVGRQRFINTEASVGNLVGRELAEGRINHKQAQEMIEMLQARFQGGERSPSRLVQEARNLGNIGLLGNIVSAATQLADSAMAVYAHGLRPTLVAVARQFTGKSKITTRDMGLADHIAEEFVSPTRTAKWLNSVFKYSGFAAVDRFGKNVQLGGAMAKYERWAQSAAGQAKIAEKYRAAYGEEFPLLVRDLQQGRMSERVRALLFSELSDMQPISKMELPEAYLRHPNGRLVYMLKTFMLKQMDVVRRDAYNEIKKGNVAKGIENLMKYAIVLGLAETSTQMVKDWLMGRPVDFMPTDIPQNVLKTFGWSQFVLDKIRQGRPIEATVNAFAPPYQMMDDIIRGDPKAVQYVPLIGKLYYNWELGGREAGEIYRSKQTGKELSERALEYRRQKREKAAARREAQ